MKLRSRRSDLCVKMYLTGKKNNLSIFFMMDKLEEHKNRLATARC